MILFLKEIGKLRLIIAIWAAFLILTQSLTAGELGHYIPGVSNIRDFIVPDPGVHYMQYNILYKTDTYKDGNGDTVDSIGSINIDVDIESFAIVPVLIWSTSKKILGARYAMLAMQPITNISFQSSLDTTIETGLAIDEAQWGLGDLYIRPIWLGWKFDHFAISTGYGVYAPSGRYDYGAVDNTGLGFWTHEFLVGTTIFPWKHQGTALMINGVYEIHHDVDGVDITPGDRFTIDWGISQLLPVNKAQTMIVELGVSGYSQWQVEKDSGRDVSQLAKKDEVHGIGGQIGFAYTPWGAFLTFRYVKEYDAEARFEGDLFSVSFAKSCF